jgi:hypothetical protein
MRLFLRNALIASSLVFVSPHAATSQDTTAGRLHIPAGNNGAYGIFSADSIVREDPPNPGPSPFASVIHLRGHVEFRACCVQRPQSPGNPDPQKAYMILHAGEADYHGDTGEIEARGDVRVSFQPSQPAR